VKLAILTILTGMSLDAAQTSLAGADGFLRRALSP